MMTVNRPAIRSLLLALIVVVGMTVPALAISASPGESAFQTNVPGPGATAAQVATQTNASVNITVGQQLATVITVSSDEVQTEFENTAFELSIEATGDEAQAKAIAERADDLRDRAEAIREDYEAATEAYEDGELTKSEYAQRLASLNARANNLIASSERLNQRAQNVSGLELRAAGANLSSLNASLENLSSVTGPGSSALLAQYLGEADGEIELETAGGLKIEIEREDGEQSREFERPRDDDMNITVRHADALQTARDALSTPEEGRWILTESKVKAIEGAYEFEFVLADSANLTGEAEVRVDGSTGEVYRLEQETERRGNDEDEEDELEDEENDDRDELTMLVVGGTPEPGATITIRVIADGEPVENVTVSLNDHEIGTTDTNGTIEVTLPDAGEAELTAKKDEAEGEFEFEFEDEHEQETQRVFEQLDVAANLGDGTVTVEVHFDSEPVRNATVYVDDERIGKTDIEGAVTFSFIGTAHDELELEVVKGEFEAELTYLIQDGTLVLTEEEHEGDGDKAEREEDDEADEEEEANEDDEVEAEDKEDEDDDVEEEADDDRSLTMSVIHGTADPGATITVEVLTDGEPAEGATITVNGEFAGTTDADGTLEVALPDEDSIELRAEDGDAETRLEFDFEEADETEEEESEDSDESEP